ncbi:MAG: hypothetical protein CL840_18925 [Crocinitomicaceae bacterium]|nr:hypothetical protein [Crocinitomicaceae bacterium]|tara:strand:- start:7048 stop:7440 length:393 start_codon:yes stop_codon:yes gene_type:complete
MSWDIKTIEAGVGQLIKIRLTLYNEHYHFSELIQVLKKEHVPVGSTLYTFCYNTLGEDWQFVVKIRVSDEIAVYEGCTEVILSPNDFYRINNIEGDTNGLMVAVNSNGDIKHHEKTLGKVSNEIGGTIEQ